MFVASAILLFNNSLGTSFYPFEFLCYLIFIAQNFFLLLVKY